jgi:hypothetical protein
MPRPAQALLHLHTIDRATFSDWRRTPHQACVRVLVAVLLHGKLAPF